MARAIAGSASLLHKAISFLSSREIHLKKEQDIAIKSLLKEKDMLAVLPTGFGKKPCVSIICYHYIDGFGFIEWLCLGNLSPQEYDKRSD